MPDGPLACSSITTPSLARQKRMLSSTTETSMDLRVLKKAPLICTTGLILDFGKTHEKRVSLPRLLRSLIGLKRVIMNAAHFLVMKNKEFYRFYQTEPFLETVRSQRLLRSEHTHTLIICFFLALEALFLFFVQDDRRATQDSLPQRTLIELDPAGPRYSHHSLSPFIFSPHPPHRRSPSVLWSLVSPPPTPIFTQTGTWLCSTPLSRSVCAQWRCWWTRWRCGCSRRMGRPFPCSWALSGALLVRWAQRSLR